MKKTRTRARSERPRYPSVEIVVTTIAGRGHIPQVQKFNLSAADIVINGPSVSLKGTLGIYPSRVNVKQNHESY